MRQIMLAAAYLRFNSDKKLFTLMLAVIVTLTVDSQIGYVADFIPEQLSSGTGISIFIVIAAVFVVTQYFVLGYVRQLNKETKDRISHLQLLHRGVSIGQYILLAVIALAVLQILLIDEYSIITLYVTYAISYGLWIIILAFLAAAFFSWYRFSNKDIMVLILALSMIAYVINGIAGLAEFSDMLTQQKPIVTAEDAAYFPEFSIESVGSQIGLVNHVASTAAYILTWIGTVKMLYPYIKRLGKFKFWIIMGVAMGYYLIEYPLAVLGYFTPSEDTDAMTNILIFSL